MVWVTVVSVVWFWAWGEWYLLGRLWPLGVFLAVVVLIWGGALLHDAFDEYFSLVMRPLGRCDDGEHHQAVTEKSS